MLEDFQKSILEISWPPKRDTDMHITTLHGQCQHHTEMPLFQHNSIMYTHCSQTGRDHRCGVCVVPCRRWQRSQVWGVCCPL